MKKIPEFQTVEEEVEFWENNSTAEYWDEMKEVSVEIDLRKDLLHPRLTVIAGEISDEFRASHQLQPISLEYMTRYKDQLLVIRDVPAFYSKKDQREYISELTSNQIDHLLELERTKRVQPATTMRVPVFDLMAAT